MRFWELFIRNLKETYRDLLALGFLLAFPLLFMVIFGAALGGGNTPVYKIAVVDEDQTPVSETFVDQALEQVSTFDISRAKDTDDALAQLKLGDLRAFIVVPPGFGDSVSIVKSGGAADIRLDITYDESDMAAPSDITSTVNQVLRQFAGIAIPITINAHPVNIQQKTTEIDFLAPGIIVFGLLIMIPTSARIMVRDKEKGYMARLLTTPTHPWEFISGYTLCLLLIAIVQIIFFILLGWAFGMNIVGSLALAFLLFALTALSSIGIGMVVAALSKSENQAEPLTWLFAMPLAVLSGVWFSISFMPKYIQTIANLFPFAHAVEASRAVLLRGAGLAAVQGDVIFLAVWSAGAILAGIFLFSRTMRT
jgi:ABC-2 type transport system permease protein